jgi:hypothetical protein
MSLQSEISDLDKALRDAGVSVDAVLQEAGINRSTWTRWKSGAVPGARYDDVMRVKEVAAASLEKASAESPRSREPEQASAA